MKSVGGLKGGFAKKAGIVSGIKAGVKKDKKEGKTGLALGKDVKTGFATGKAGGINFKKSAVIAGKVAGAKKMIAGKGLKG